MTKRKDPKDFKKNGRPSKYTPELAKEICDAISTSELGLVHLVDLHPHWPERATIFLWRRTQPGFSDMYTKAKEDQQEVSVEYMQEIMNEAHTYIDRETGMKRVDVPMLRLKMDAIKWHAAKLKPRVYGDAKVQEPVNNEVDADCKKRYQQLDDRNRKEF